MAIGGPEAAQVAADLGDAIFATGPEAELVDAYRKAGGGPRYGEVPLAWAPDEATTAFVTPDPGTEARPGGPPAAAPDGRTP